MNSRLKSLDNKTILITGGAGFIGSNLALYFQKNYPTCKVVVFDCFRTNQVFENGNLKSFGHFKNLIDFNGEIITGDISRKENFLRLLKLDVDYVFHQAAISDTTVLDQERMLDVNLNAFKDIIEFCIEKRANLVYASSGATYGDAVSPQTVGIENPLNVYGFSKLMMDRLAKKYDDVPISIVGLRYFNVYGPREFYKNKTSSMVLQLGLQLLNGKAPRLFEESDKILRDFIYIDDVIDANVLAMDAEKSGVYNVGTSNPRSFQDIADILQRYLGTNYKTEYFKNPYKAYQIHTQANIESTIKELGFTPKVSLEEGIGRYISEIERIFKEEYIVG